MFPPAGTRPSPRWRPVGLVMTGITSWGDGEPGDRQPRRPTRPRRPSPVRALQQSWRVPWLRRPQLQPQAQVLRRRNGVAKVSWQTAPRMKIFLDRRSRQRNVNVSPTPPAPTSNSTLEQWRTSSLKMVWLPSNRHQPASRFRAGASRKRASWKSTTATTTLTLATPATAAPLHQRTNS